MVNKKLQHFLAECDATMVVLLGRLSGDPEFSGISSKKPLDYANSLYRAVVSQQLSVKAADTIYKRFVALLGDDLSPENVLGFSVEQLRSVGLSGQKASYVHAIALAAMDGSVDFETLDSLSDEEVINKLTDIKGIGLWSAEMFLIFTLGRENVFSAGDAGLRRAIQINYPEAQLKTKEDYEAFAERWAPYKSYASLALWHSLDNK